MTRTLRWTTIPLFAGFLVSALVFFGTSAATAAGVRAACPYSSCGQTASLTVTSVQQTPAGLTTITVSGSGFGPNETVSLEAFSGHGPGEFVGTAPTNSGGSFANASFRLPAGLQSGTVTLVGTGSASGNVGTTTFHLDRATSAANPCVAAYSSAHAEFVLAAAVTTACISGQAPGAGAATAQPGPATPAKSGSLPITGTDAAAIAGGGALAVLIGGLLVLSSRRRKAGAWR